MRASSLAWLAALATLASGCLGGGSDERGEGAGPIAGWTLACEIATATWPEPCLALASPNDSPSKTEVDLAVNPTDPRNVVVGSKDNDPNASDCVWAVPQASKDGGATWTTSYIGGERASRQPGQPLYGWRCITDPIMVFDAQGTLYYSLQAYDHTRKGSELPGQAGPTVGTVGSSILMARSKDGGETWERIITLHAGEGNLAFHDYMRMLVNPVTGSVHTVWNQYTTAGLPTDVAALTGPVTGPGRGTVVPVLVTSRDKGETAAAPVYVPQPDRVTEGTEMRGFAVASDGTMYLSIQDGSPARNGTAYFSSSTDDGRTWSQPKEYATHFGLPRQMKNNSYRTIGGFELAVDVSGGPRDGTIYAVSGDYTDDDSDLILTVSADKGATWTPPRQINTGEWARGDQWIPRPFVDARGTLHLLYFDKSRDPANYGIDATWAASEDGGATWAFRRLTEHPFDGNLGIHQDGFPFIGDYLGIGGVGDTLYFGFPTTVTGRAEVAVAKAVRAP